MQIWKDTTNVIDNIIERKKITWPAMLMQIECKYANYWNWELSVELAREGRDGRERLSQKIITISEAGKVIKISSSRELY